MKFDVDDYQQFCAGIECRPDPETMLQDPELTGAVMEFFSFAKLAGQKADKLKKRLMYQRKHVIPERELGHRPEFQAGPITLSSQQARLLHAVLGISSEVDELIDALYCVFNDRPEDIDLVNIQEEFADAGWYVMVGMDAAGINPSTAMARNEAKLTARNKGKTFNHEGNDNRDLENERALLEGDGSQDATD